MRMTKGAVTPFVNIGDSARINSPRAIMRTRSSPELRVRAVVKTWGQVARRIHLNVHECMEAGSSVNPSTLFGLSYDGTQCMVRNDGIQWNCCTVAMSRGLEGIAPLA